MVADVDADLEGEQATGSLDVEERNAIPRTTLRAADLVVVVGLPGMKGLHSLLRSTRDLLAHGVPGGQLVPVLNRAPKSPRARAELAAAFGDLLDGSGPGHGVRAPSTSPSAAGSRTCSATAPACPTPGSRRSPAPSTRCSTSIDAPRRRPPTTGCSRCHQAPSAPGPTTDAARASRARPSTMRGRARTTVRGDEAVVGGPADVLPSQSARVASSGGAQPLLRSNHSWVAASAARRRWEASRCVEHPHPAGDRVDLHEGAVGDVVHRAGRADHRRQPELTGDDGRVRQEPAFLDHHRARDGEHHVVGGGRAEGHEDVAGLESIERVPRIAATQARPW